MTPLILFAALTGDPLGPKIAKCPNEILITQVLLDRAGHSPGVFDGKWGSNSRRAVAAFERATGLPVDGEIDPDVSGRCDPTTTRMSCSNTRSSRRHRSAYRCSRNHDRPVKARALGFETALEALAEKFQMSQGLMQRLNVGKDFSTPGTIIQVVMPVAASFQPKSQKLRSISRKPSCVSSMQVENYWRAIPPQWEAATFLRRLERWKCAPSLRRQPTTSIQRAEPGDRTSD